MSRIGNKPIILPQGVTVDTSDRGNVVVKGPKGQLSQVIESSFIALSQVDDKLKVTRANNDRQTRAFHGLIRSLVNNMVTGVSDGYEKRLELIGTGYRVKKEGTKLVLTLGYSHPLEVEAPEGITFEVEGNNLIAVKGIDKQKVGQVAAQIRALRKPEPYKGKGVRYSGEVVRRKAGKTVKATQG